MLRCRRKIELVMVTVFLLFAWFLFGAHFSNIQEDSVKGSVHKRPWQYEATEPEDGQKIVQQEIAHSVTEEDKSSASTISQHVSTPAQSTAVATPSLTPPCRVVVMAKIPKEDTRWVHSELPDW